MKYVTTAITLTLLLAMHGHVCAATSPYAIPPGTTTTTTKPATSTVTNPTSTKSTTKPVGTTSKSTTKPAAKPAAKIATKPKPVTPPPPPPPPPPEEPFFSNWGIGLIVLSQSVDVESSTGVTSNESGSGIGIYAEKYFSNRYRLVGTFSYVSYDDFVIPSAVASADYLLPINANVAAFGGLAVGGAAQKYSNSGFSDMALGLVYGAQLGGILYVSDNLMLELGYRLRLTNLTTEITTTPTSTVKVDSMNETYLSLIFSF